MTTMTGQVLKVNREKLTTCMTCPICNKLFRDATTISECLHSFCRKCIYEKIAEEDLNSCPVCNTYLGCAPLEKLRADHNLQDLRFKIFPSKRKNSSSPEAVSSVPLPARRKERSLSSLVTGTPKVLANSSSSGRRLKTGPRKTLAFEDSAFSFKKPVNDVENPEEILSSSENLNKPTQDRIQRPDKGTKDSAEPLEGKADLWKPLNVLVEAAGKINYHKFNSQGTVGKSILIDANANELLPKANSKECGNASKVRGNENDAIPGSSGSVKPRKSQGRPRKAALSEGFNISAQTVVDTYSKFDGRFGPIWFSLVASDKQDADEPLPQISSCYLRLKDGSLPVSFIKKYLMKKLNLASEAEVEISLRGQPVLSTLQLHSLVTSWIQTASASERIQTLVGSSAKDFVMVLTYGRKAHPP